jgi:hypothetical protein
MYLFQTEQCDELYGIAYLVVERGGKRKGWRVVQSLHCVCMNATSCKMFQECYCIRVLGFVSKVM